MDQIGDSDWSQYFDFFRRQAKATIEYKKLSQRKYQQPEGYLSYDLLIERIAVFLLVNGNAELLTKVGVQTLPDPLLRTLGLSVYAAQTDAPAYWLASDLFTALQQTELPPTLSEIRRVLPCGILLFPDGWLNPDQQPVQFLIWEHWLAGETRPLLETSQGVGVTTKTIEQDTIAWASVSPNGDYTAGVVKIEPSQSSAIAVQHTDLTFEGRGDVQAVAQDEQQATEDQWTQFIQRVSGIVVQTILILQTMPELVEHESSLNVLRRKKKTEQRWSPRWIGRTYQVQVSKPASDSEVAGCEGEERADEPPLIHRTSPRPHWRKGHWQRFLVGKRSESQREWRWVHPVFVRSLTEK